MASPSAEQVEYFGPLLDHTEDAIVACDADWRVTVWNEGARRMYGWSAEEALGRPETFFRLDETDDQRMGRRRQLAEYGRWRGEIMVQRKDGSKVPVESISVAIRAEQGGMRGYLGIHRDITDRKHAEEALRAAHRRTEAILERISDTFFAVDEQWRYTYVNERAVAEASKAWGREVSAEELLGKDCWELFPKTAGTAFDRELHRAVREQRVVEFEAYSLAMDAWVEVRAYPSRDGLSVYSRDVTARRRGREALAYHASLLENVEDGLIAMDADDFRIIAWNKGAERLYGFAAEEVLGRPAREVASYPSDKARDKLEHELLESGRTRIEFTSHRNDGAPIEVELVAAEVRDDRGEVIGYLGIHRDISERKRAERAFREARRRSETILESITDDFVAVDRDWRYIYINDRALRSTQEWLGWAISREELLGRSLWEVFPETVGTVPYVKYHEAVREGRSVEFETYFAAKDRWFETHVYPSESGLSIYFRTITERKRAEEQLAYYARLVENMEDAVIATDDEFVVSAWNRGAQRLYGWTAKEALGRHVMDVVRTGLNDEELDARFGGIVDVGRDRTELVAYRKDGTTVDAEIITVAIRGERGEATGYLAIHRDITERKQAEEKLAYHAQLLENMNDAVLATDERLVLTAWNKAAERMFGWTTEEAVGQLVYELLPSSFSQAELAADIESLAETGHRRTEATWFGKGGTPVFAESSNVALRSEAGSVMGYLGIMRDLSERQRARKELEMRARQQALLAELTLRNLANGELQALLDDAVTLVAGMLEVELSSIAEILPGGREMSWRAAFGWDQEAVTKAAPSPATSESLVGYAFTAGGPVISEDVRNDSRFQISESFAQERPASAIAVVIPVVKERFGALVAASRAHRLFTSEDVDFVRAVATIIGVAVERSQVAERLEEVRENERSRIARDLHDDALGELAGAVAQASMAASASASQGDKDRWTSQLAMLQRVGWQLRNSIYNLRLTGEEHRPFVDLLSELVAHHSEMTEGRDVRLEGHDTLPTWSLGKNGSEILRIVGEAITNARRHSGATTITVDASGSDAAVLRLNVRDDGTWQATTASAVPGQGTGITGMTERADLLGARLNIGADPGGGTVVTVELKLASSRQEGR